VVCVSVCLCAGHKGEPCKMAEAIEVPIRGDSHTCAQGNIVLDGVQFGATWRIRLIDLCSEAMRAVATITIATCLVLVSS